MSTLELVEVGAGAGSVAWEGVEVGVEIGLKLGLVAKGGVVGGKFGKVSKG